MLSFGINYDEDKKKYKLFSVHRFYNDKKTYLVTHTISYHNTFEDAVENYRIKMINILGSIEDS